jgi:hypothetical protein
VAELDLGGLSDDQLLGLLRAVLQEAVRRHPGVSAAAHAAVLDEEEKARIFMEASEKEARIARARERERIAAEAQARVRAEQAAANAEAEARREQAIREAKEKEAEIKARANAERIVAEATREIARAEARESNHRDLLLRASALVDLPPGNICLVVYKENVYINEGSDRYEKDHLASFRGLKLSTKQSLISRKPGLLSLCAELRATYTDVEILGSDHFPRVKKEMAS